MVQKDDYLPFGLSFNSYSRAAITKQNFKFNAGSELEEMTDWYSTPFRKYDPSLGRFHGVDALADMYTGITPSHFGMNNPVNYNDPTGLTTQPGDPENGGDGGAGGGLWGAGYNIRGYDNVAKAEQGHGGNNGWASAGRNGSLYTRAYGAPSKYAALYLAMKETNDVVDVDWDKLHDGRYDFYFSNGNLTGFEYFAPEQLQGGQVASGEGMNALGMELYFATGMISSSFDPEDQLHGDMEGTSFWGRDGTTNNVQVASQSSSIFDREPGSMILAYGDFERAAFWAGEGDISRTILYGASGASDLLGVAAIGKGLMKAGAILLIKQAGKSAATSGWVKRSVYNSLDRAIQKKVEAAIKNGIVPPVGSQGIIKLTATEAKATGFGYKIKILGKGGDIRIYGNQGANGHIFFEKIIRH